MTRNLAFALLAILACVQSLAAETVAEWNFDSDLQGWGPPGGLQHIADLRVENGAMHGRITGNDPFVHSPLMSVPASLSQQIELRLRTDAPGTAQIFFTNTTETQYGGFSPGQSISFQLIADGEWHDYTVQPYWEALGTLIKLRLDLPHLTKSDLGRYTFDADSIRITQAQSDLETVRFVDLTPPGSTSLVQGSKGVSGGVVQDKGARWGGTNGEVLCTNRLAVSADSNRWVGIEMAVTSGECAILKWASSFRCGRYSRRFSVHPDGRYHTYNINLMGDANWGGDAVMLWLAAGSDDGFSATVRRIYVADGPRGPANIEVGYVGLTNAINHPGVSVPMTLHLTNRGGRTTRNLRIADITLPPGVRVADGLDVTGAIGASYWAAVPPCEPFDPVDFTINLMADRPVRGEAKITLKGVGAPAAPISAMIEFTPDPGLPKADYVPEPQPVQSDYEIGAFYFPGWYAAEKWAPIRRIAPERKPLLGWYDEANPECADWQIKWAVENGISFFMVDWYWSGGSRSLTHWVENAYANARYREYLKWCVMWANHNPAGTHSLDDMRAVATYWVENYFGTDEYYKIDGKPVVVIWSPYRIRADMGSSAGAREALDTCRKVAKAAGFAGIYFVAMSTSTEGDVRVLADEGYDMTTTYHYMGHGGMATDPQRYSFELVAKTNHLDWERFRDIGILPNMGNISTGWDSRPWHEDRATAITGRTVPLFREILRDAKRFADKTGAKILTLGPLNEWGEGSYAEPNTEYGFGMYNAIREELCNKPEGGWPANITPQDSGLGPYDFPEPLSRTAWDFEDGAQGWQAQMGIGDFVAADGEIRFVSATKDPAIGVSVAKAYADRYSHVVVRMKSDSDAMAQLFWATTMSGVNEAASVRFKVTGDGKYHDYSVDVSAHELWKGRVTAFRFDPCDAPGVHMTIAEIQLVEK